MTAVVSLDGRSKVTLDLVGGWSTGCESWVGLASGGRVVGGEGAGSDTLRGGPGSPGCWTGAGVEGTLRGAAGGSGIGGSGSASLVAFVRML